MFSSYDLLSDYHQIRISERVYRRRLSGYIMAIKGVFLCYMGLLIH